MEEDLLFVHDGAVEEEDPGDGSHDGEAVEVLVEVEDHEDPLPWDDHQNNRDDTVKVVVVRVLRHQEDRLLLLRAEDCSSKRGCCQCHDLFRCS